MINQVYQLVSPRQFETTFKTINLHNHNNKIIVRPLYLSICAADLRYYCGNRGTKVVMIPNTPSESHKVIAENYLASSHFKSSGYDGFM